MNQTLHALGGIVLSALPTFFLVIILGFYLKFVFFKPLDKVLAERFRLTEGARKAAEESFKSADARLGEYQAQLSRARTEIYREQEEFLRKLHAEQSEQIQQIRAESERRVSEAKNALGAEAQAARQTLEAQSEALAAQIADAILRQRVVA